MGKIATYKFLTFFFLTYDAFNSFPEDPHVHVSKYKKGGYFTAAKIWIETGEIEYRGELSQKELNLAQQLVNKYRDYMLEQWKKVATGGKADKAKKLNLK